MLRDYFRDIVSYQAVAAFNDGRWADMWFEKTLAAR
jgi:hypothetical protein